jgi:thiosulfate reductase cytochrome b subunit
LELTSVSSALSIRAAPTPPRVIVRHSALVRVCHWINAGCFIVLLMSGMQIFNADPQLTWGKTTNFDRPFFSLSAREDSNGDPTAGVTTIFGRPFDTTGLLGASPGDDGELEARGFPSWATLPSFQDLATGRRWHFFFAWILVLNGLVYFVNLIARRHIRDLWPSLADLKALPRAILDHVRLRFPSGDEALRYNVLQKLAYLSVVIAFPVLILAGLTMSPGMDSGFPWLLTLFGGRQAARAVHFLLAAYLVLFVIVHLAMVVLSGPINNMRSMITGRYRIKEEV